MFENQISKSMGWPFMVVYLLLILGAFYFTFSVVPKAINSNDWPQAQGQVTNSEVVQRSRTHRSGKRITVYSAKIQYQYNVNDNLFTNYQLKWADRNGPAQAQQDMNKHYPTGANITVFYNPEKPSESVLQKGLSLDYMLVGLFLLVSIAVMGYALFRNARNRRPR